MVDLLAENGALRTGLLLLLFALVVAASYFAAQAIASRGMTRRRLLEEVAPGHSGAATMGSLRAERAESTWLKLVNAIEKRGLSLVDSKDHALRQKLIAAGFTAT